MVRVNTSTFSSRAGAGSATTGGGVGAVSPALSADLPAEPAAGSGPTPAASGSSPGGSDAGAGDPVPCELRSLGSVLPEAASAGPLDGPSEALAAARPGSPGTSIAPCAEGSLKVGGALVRVPPELPGG